MIQAPRRFTPEEKAAYNAKWYPRQSNPTQPEMIDASPIYGLSKATAYKYLGVIRKIKAGHTVQEACTMLNVRPDTFRQACQRHHSLQKRKIDAEQSLVELAETALKKSALGLAQDVQEIFEVDEETGQQKLTRKIVTTQKPEYKAINKILTNLAPEKWNKDKEETTNNTQNNILVSMPSVTIGGEAITFKIGEPVENTNGNSKNFVDVDRDTD